MSQNKDKFHIIAGKASKAVGSPAAFIIALSVIILWAVCGPIFKYSDTWQLVINTSTTIVTFLMVFLIQNTQNRDAQAMHLKLDELIYSMQGARNSLIDLEDLSEEELQKLQKEFITLKHLGENIQKQGSASIEKELHRRRHPKKHSNSHSNHSK